jgi:hypothetical protein
MESSTTNVTKKTETDAFNRWIADVREDIGSRYGYEDRKKHIQILMGYLVEYGIAMDDAQFLKKRVVEALVTKEGMKGKGKHSGWKENTEADFDDAIQKTYVPGLKKAEFMVQKTAQGYDPRKVKWAKEKFGDHVGEDIIIAVHQPLHLFWIMFMREYHKINTEGII